MNQIVRLDTAAGSARARFTTAEFVQMSAAGAFADMTIELIDGELERMTPPMSDHGRSQMRVGLRLARQVPEDRLFGEVGIDLGDDTVVACDVAVTHTAVTERRLLRPADIALAVEVADTTLTRDRSVKASRYAAAGIGIYWVVDTNRRVTHVHSEPVDGEYALIATVRFGEALAVPGTEATIVLD